MNKRIFIAVVLLLAGLAGLVLWRYADDVTSLMTMTSHDERISEHGDIAIERFTLSNGLEVVLLPNHRLPAISHTLWLRVGAADDPPLKSGLAHYHEHLMFKGTPDAPDDTYTRRIESLGGEFNAFTGYDFTGYYVNIAREHLEEVMRLEADRMQHLAPAPEEYKTERDVIIEERHSRIDNRPSALFGEQMQAALFMHHPYRIPIIGWQHEMKQLSAQDAQAFYARYYHAGNMLLVVAGDITREQLEPLAQRYYGALRSDTPAKREWTQEPPQLAARRLSMHHREVASPRFERRYLAPSLGYGQSEQVMPLSLLAQWLGGGKSSLLYQELVERQKLAVSVSADYSGFTRGPESFTLHAQPSDGVSPEQLEAAIDEVLIKARQTQIAPDDLARIKTLFSASVIYARDSLSALAHYTGYLLMLDQSLDLLLKWQESVDAVSAQHIQEAAQTVLVPEHSVTGYLLPELSGKEDADATP